jgi:hypothetical protein
LIPSSGNAAVSNICGLVLLLREAYTPLSERKLGYYAIPLLWHDDVIGWVNVSTKNHDKGYAAFLI